MLGEWKHALLSSRASDREEGGEDARNMRIAQHDEFVEARLGASQTQRHCGLHAAQARIALTRHVCTAQLHKFGDAQVSVERQQRGDGFCVPALARHANGE